MAGSVRHLGPCLIQPYRARLRPGRRRAACILGAVGRRLQQEKNGRELFDSFFFCWTVNVHSCGPKHISIPHTHTFLPHKNHLVFGARLAPHSPAPCSMHFTPDADTHATSAKPPVVSPGT
jgi:hypothetical protein